MSDTRKPTKILSMGKLVVEEQMVRVVDINLLDQNGAQRPDMEAFNPAFGFTKDPVVFQNPMAMFGCASSIEELNEAIKPHYENLPWELFELIATFSETFRISIMVSANKTITALLESNESTTLAWWVPNQGVIYTSSTDRVQAIQRRPLNPSEVLYAFSIALAQLGIGAPAVSISRTEDNEGVAVTYIDQEMAMSNPGACRISFVFPSMATEVKH
ncbi:hypothetical protein CPT_Moabite_015 [Serratia phage Moabite]|uniref:Uncharacterized protein n=3 Tax=Moabitevirus TaxID=2843422 RepID=A0A7T3NBY1_9CAUD|nr:hypothetical protein HWB23_gp284 [Serratia phage vB_SmaM_ 2050HW]YP_009849111.1 hypothetical protein HWC48_gp015 [Serratia phage Moabite]QPX76802.1 hypothetical protein [Serratia phage vB_SmaM_Yaphecito]UCR74558.1 hypothetical protein [Serratia phage BUCT660]UQT03739.1 hypothetical protein KODAMA_02720 [Serratia phage vB_SmaM-Kodama]URG14129.1 hypothetical protein [Pectobacterium phage vB_ParM-25]ATA65619.1 hypothetical protein 2050HW_00284 [Serratia phage vB_SmaM_ 2050HW]